MRSVLTINGGSSSIKFAFFQADETLKRGLVGKVDRIGLSGTNLTFHDPDRKEQGSRKLAAPDHKSAAHFLIDWLEEQNGLQSLPCPLTHPVQAIRLNRANEKSVRWLV